MEKKAFRKCFYLLDFVEISSLIILIKTFSQFHQQITMLRWKYYKFKIALASGTKEFSGILTLASLSVDEIEKKFLSK